MLSLTGRIDCLDAHLKDSSFTLGTYSKHFQNTQTKTLINKFLSCISNIYNVLPNLIQVAVCTHISYTNNTILFVRLDRHQCYTYTAQTRMHTVKRISFKSLEIMFLSSEFLIIFSSMFCFGKLTNIYDNLIKGVKIRWTSFTSTIQ